MKLLRTYSALIIGKLQYTGLHPVLHYFVLSGLFQCPHRDSVFQTLFSYPELGYFLRLVLITQKKNRGSSGEKPRFFSRVKRTRWLRHTQARNRISQRTFYIYRQEIAGQTRKACANERIVSSLTLPSVAETRQVQ